jgi:uncharacterized protein YfiM (DUF2279 family)
MITHLLVPLLLAAADTGVTRLREKPQPVLELPEPDRWIGEDKFRHFFYSYAITTGTAGAARAVTGHDESVVVGAAIGLLAGVGKELYDRKGNGTASFRDLLWDVAGVTVGVLVAQHTR